MTVTVTLADAVADRSSTSLGRGGRRGRSTVGSVQASVNLPGRRGGCIWVRISCGLWLASLAPTPPGARGEPISDVLCREECDLPENGMQKTDDQSVRDHVWSIESTSFDVLACRGGSDPAGFNESTSVIVAVKSTSGRKGTSTLPRTLPVVGAR